MIVIAAAISAAHVVRLYYLFPRTYDASVRANKIELAPHVSGWVMELPIVDNQFVHKNDLLFKVDSRPYLAKLHKAQSDLQITDFHIEASKSDISAAQEEKRRRAATLLYDRQYLERLKPLLARHFVTANDVYKATQRVRADEAAVANAENRVQAATHNLTQSGELNARRKAAEAALELAQINVNYCEVRAPFDGHVTDLNISLHEYANEGKPVLTLVDDRTWYVIANYREEFLRFIKPGMDVSIYVQSYPYNRMRGHVEGTGWGLHKQDGETSPISRLPKVEPTLDWVILSQRFPVRIIVDDRDPAHPLRIGQTAVVTLDGYRQRR